MVQFSSDELAYIGQVAGGRNALKWQHGLGTSGTYVGLDTTDDMHFCSTLAEYAVARVVGGEVDERRFVGGHTQGNVILPGHLGRGRACYRSERGRDFGLKDTNIDHFYGDFGFLVYPVFEHVAGGGRSLEVVAWISREEFAQVAHVERLRGERLICRRSEMHRMSEPLHRPLAVASQIALL